MPGSPGVGTGVPGTATSGVPGTGGAPPGNPYQDILQNDPFYQQLLKDLSAQGIADEAGARAQAQRGFITFGDTTGFDQPYSGWIDDNTRRLAGQNTSAGLSISARIAKQNRDSIRMIRSQLASRGALRSGELGHQLGEEQLRFSQANYDSRSQLTDLLSGISAGLAAAQRARSQQQAQGVSDAFGRAPTTPPTSGGGGGGGGGSSTPNQAPTTTPETGGGFPVGYGNLNDEYALNLGRQRRGFI